MRHFPIRLLGWGRTHASVDFISPRAAREPFNALMTPIGANIVGPPDVATRISAHCRLPPDDRHDDRRGPSRSPPLQSWPTKALGWDRAPKKNQRAGVRVGVGIGGELVGARSLGGVDSRDSLLGANQIQGCFWGGSLGCDGTVGFEGRGVGADSAADHRPS